MASLLHTYARPTKSYTHGIGMKAIQKIPKGTIVAPHIDVNGVWRNINYLQKYENIENGPIDMMQDYICRGKFTDYLEGNFVFVPNEPLTSFPIQMLINHSSNPNLKINHLRELEAIRDIQTGEELTEDYLCVCGINFLAQRIK
uniref:SET domain-containing protein n=1 Tax=viral metagenome TaxID=1070528 RepID=A0A6C0FDY3_9ZZZZ|tara:strand:+ start:2534 stop:2965 length:432 start_codon:yes stop_codon:yes gene_type:complete